MIHISQKNLSTPFFVNILWQYIFFWLNRSIANRKHTYLEARLFHKRKDQRHKRLMWDQQHQLAKYLQKIASMHTWACMLYFNSLQYCKKNTPYRCIIIQGIKKLHPKWYNDILFWTYLGPEFTQVHRFWNRVGTE